MIDAQTKYVAIFGDPVSHSLSPQMHNAAFNQLGLNMAYLAFRVEEASDATTAMRMLDNVRQATIEPVIRATVAEGTRFFTDEYNIYDRLPSWGYDHHTVCHSRGEYARDDDGDGFHEIHVNTIEGVWSLLRSWLRPHRGVSQENLPFYLGFFQFVHNARVRGKSLLKSLLAVLLP